MYFFGVFKRLKFVTRLTALNKRLILNAFKRRFFPDKIPKSQSLSERHLIFVKRRIHLRRAKDILE